MKKFFEGRKMIIIILVCAVVLTGFAGVLGKASRSSNDTAFGSYALNGTSSIKDSAPEISDSYESGAYNEAAMDVSGTVAEAPSSGSSGSAIQPPQAGNSERIVVRNANISLESEHYSDFTESMTSKVETLGGYVQAMDEHNYNASDDKKIANMTVRVPADKLDAFIAFLEESAAVKSKSVSVDDITSDYVDIESHINTLKVEQETLTGLLAKANSLSDTIQIQDRLTQVRQEIEYYQSMFNRLKNDVSYSTVEISLREVSRESSNETGFWSDIKNGFIESLYSVGEGFMIMIIWFITSLPYIAIAFVFGIIIYALIRKIRKSRSKSGIMADRGEADGGQTDH